jgi:drug/metabolite transporter (DMT)-like permease
MATGATMVLFWAGLQRLDPSFNAFLHRGQPLFIILLGAAVLRERLRPVEIAPMAIMVAGGFLSVAGQWAVIGAGVVFTVLSDVTNAFERVIAKAETHRVHPAAIVFYRAAIASLAIALWVVLTGRADFRVPLVSRRTARSLPELRRPLPGLPPLEPFALHPAAVDATPHGPSPGLLLSE